MVGKNNYQVKKEKQGNKFYRYSIKRLSVGVASVAVAAGLLFAGDVQVARAAGTNDAVNGELNLTAEEQGKVDQAAKDNENQPNTQKTTSDPVTKQVIPADGGVAETIETEKDLKVQDPKLAEKIESQSDNGASDGAVSTKPAPKAPALEEKTEVANAPTTDEDGTERTGQPLNSNDLNAALDQNNPEGSLKQNNIRDFGIDIEDLTDEESTAKDTLKIENRVYLETVPPVDRYEVRYEIDERLAKHITDIRYIASDSDKTSDRDFSFTRMQDAEDPSKLTNTWRANAFDVNIASTSSNPNAWNNYDSVFASSQTGFSRLATVQVKFNKSLADIIGAYPDARRRNELFFNAYIYDPVEKKIVERTVDTAVVKTEDTNLDKLQAAGHAQEVEGEYSNSNGFGQYVEGGTYNPHTGQYDENAKVRGIAVDQYFTKKTSNSSPNSPASYHFQADERLVPYIKGVGIYQLSDGSREFDPKSQVFYNGLILHAKGGVAKTLPIASDGGLDGKFDQYFLDYNPRTGAGRFRLDPNDKVQFNEGVGGNPSSVRVVYYLKDDVNIKGLMPNNLDQRYVFNGFFLDEKGNYVANTEANIGYNFGDFSGDPSPITNEGNPGVDDTNQTNPAEGDLPEPAKPEINYELAGQNRTVLLNTEVTAKDLAQNLTKTADGQAVDLPEGTKFSFADDEATQSAIVELFEKDADGNDKLDADGNKISRGFFVDTSKLGQKEIKVVVELPRSSTSNLISGLVDVNKRPGESGQKVSEERFIPQSNEDSRNENSEGFFNNQVHQLADAITPETQAQNEIDVTISSLIHEIPSSSLETLKKWDYVIEFSDNLAKHITKVENGSGTEFERIVNRNGDKTNSWRMRAWGGAADNEALMTNTAVGAQYNYPAKVTLDSSIKSIIDETEQELGRPVTNGDFGSTSFIYNNANKAMIEGSYSSTFMKVNPTQYDEKVAADNVAKNPTFNNWFRLSGGEVSYKEGDEVSPYTGLTGDKMRGFVFDQIFAKQGGSSLNTAGATTDPIHYHYTVDQRLLPYIESAELYYVPNGKDYYNNSAVGLDKSYIPQAKVFFNGLDSRNDDFQSEFNRETGEGVFKLDPQNDTVSRVFNFNNSHLDPAAARIVYKLRDGITTEDILKAYPDASFAFTGYLTLDSGPVVRNSNANVGYRISDIDGDGRPDEFQNDRLSNLSEEEKQLLSPIEKAIVNEGLTGTNANILVQSARDKDTSVRGVVNTGFSEADAPSVEAAIVNEDGSVTALGSSAVDPQSGEYSINTPEGTTLTQGQTILITLTTGGQVHSANYTTVGEGNPEVTAKVDVLDLKDINSDQRVAKGQDMTAVKVDQFVDAAGQVNPASTENGQVHFATVDTDGQTDTEELANQLSVRIATTDAQGNVTYQDLASAGLTYNPETGQVTGSPILPEGEEEHTYTIVVDAKNAKAGDATNRTFTVTVYSQASEYTPAYEAVDVIPGNKAETASPSFTDSNSQAATPALDSDGAYTAPETVDVEGTQVAVQVDPQTGVVTVDPAETAKVPGKAITVPVTVKYQDGSTDQANATINVMDPGFIDRTNDPDAPVPEGYKKVDLIAGQGVTPFEGGNKTYHVKEGTSIPADKIPQLTAQAGYENPVWDNDPAQTVTADSPSRFTATAGQVAEADTTAPTITVSAKDIQATEGQPIDPVSVETDDPEATVTVDGLPEGLTYNPETKQIEGTVPAGTVQWADDQDESRDFPATVKAVDPAGNEATEPINVTVLRDTDGDGQADQTDDDDDNDGIPDTEDQASKTWDGLDAQTTDTTATNGQAVPDNTKVVTANKPGAKVSTPAPVDGLSVDENGNLVGTPSVDFQPGETEKVVEIPVEITSIGTGQKDGQGQPTDEAITRTVKVTVTNPNAGETPAESSVELTPKSQNALEGKDITPVTPDAKDLPEGGSVKVSIDGQDTYPGLTVDPDSGQVTGQPQITDWAPEEETRTITVTAQVQDKDGNPVRDADGNPVTAESTITVYRDTDKDGQPDKDSGMPQDPNNPSVPGIDQGDKDDDNDGWTDQEEKDRGTDGKDENSFPRVTEPGAENEPGKDTTKVTGKTTPNTEVEVKDKDGNTIGTGTSDDQGNIDLDVPKQNPGDKVTIVPGKKDDQGNFTPVKDDQGNPRGGVETVVKETPQITNPGAKNEPGSDKTQVTGKTTVPNSKVEVKDKDGNTIGTGTSDENGDFTIDVPRQEGGDTISVTPSKDYTNPDGSTETRTGDPVETTVSEESPVLSEASIEVTPKSQNALEGKDITPVTPQADNVPEGGSVKVTIDGQDSYPGLTVDPETGQVSGRPEITDWATEEETRTITVTAEVQDKDGKPVTDADGNPVTAESTITVYRDTDKDGQPDKDTGMPQDPNNPTVPGIDQGDKDDDNDGWNDQDEKDRGTDPKDQNDFPQVTEPGAENEPGKDTTTVTGKTTPNTDVEVKDKDGNTIGTGTSDDQGNVKIDVPKQNPGDEVTINPGKKDDQGNFTPVTDDQGNPQGGAETVVKETPQITNPGAKNDPDSDQTEVTGKTTVPNSTVEVKDKDGNTIGTGTSDDNGDFTIEVPRQNPGDKISVIPSKEYTNPDGSTETRTGDPVETTVTEDAPAVASVEITPKSQNALEGKDITPVTPQADNVPEGGSVKVTIDGQDNYPGLTVDPETGQVTGSPEITDWAPEEETRTITVEVSVLDKDGKPVTDADGNPVTAESTITVYRDTDKDGQTDKDSGMPQDPNNPNVPGIDQGDKDDDNDGWTDQEEKDRGTDPKNEDSFPRVTEPGAENQPGKDTTTVTGKTTPNTDVEVKDKDGNTIGTGTSDDKGNVKIDVPKQNPGDKVTIIPGKKNDQGNFKPGNPDGNGETVVKETPQIINPGAKNEPGSDKTTVTGKTTVPNTTIEVKDKDGKTIGTGTSDENGDFTIDVPRQGTGDSITIIPSKDYTNPDGSVETRTGDPVETTVTGHTPATKQDKDIYEPEYKPGTGHPGTKVEVGEPIFKDEDGKVVTPPAGTSFQPGAGETGITVDPETGAVVVEVPADAKPGDKIEKSVTVTYPDGSSETVTITVTVEEKDGSAVTPVPTPQPEPQPEEQPEVDDEETADPEPESNVDTVKADDKTVSVKTQTPAREDNSKTQAAPAQVHTQLPQTGAVAGLASSLALALIGTGSILALGKKKKED
ncbi:Ig-like domain-containing protein [Aerococcus urinae]